MDSNAVSLIYIGICFFVVLFIFFGMLRSFRKFGVNAKAQAEFKHRA